MLNTESRRIATALESATDESDRRFSELFNMTAEMFEHQVGTESTDRVRHRSFSHFVHQSSHLSV